MIEAVGAGVDAGRVGERVWVHLAAYQRPWGTAAEYTVVPSAHAVALGSASFELGASLGVPALTAYHCLFADGPIAGRSVLVAGGAGAVGHSAIELAKWAGARVVTTVSSEEKGALARAAGADAVVNYREDGAAEADPRVRAGRGRPDRRGRAGAEPRARPRGGRARRRDHDLRLGARRGCRPPSAPADGPGPRAALHAALHDPA